MIGVTDPMRFRRKSNILTFKCHTIGQWLRDMWIGTENWVLK